MEIIKTSSRGQIVIPEEIRKRHKIKEGTKLVLFEDGDRLILEKEANVEELKRVVDGKIRNLRAEEKMSSVRCILSKKDPEVLNLMMASEESLAKDWGSKEDDVWDKLY